ncbi:hypothetical protein [Phenylobacterium sp.]|uniref:hypothetical protein n=1 Tax=Phenylobacterium sp. TaxID=1871053 RepID=UPI00286D1EBD|nr:hypothetical protein [Phenylobacterium sp.]
MKSWLTILIDRGARIAGLPFVKLKVLDASIVRALEAWSWPARLRPKPKPRKRRARGPDWVAPKVMKAAIARELVPEALALGWTPCEPQRARKGERRFGEFDFERVSKDCIEHMGFDFQYGNKPDVWLCVALWKGEEGICTSFETGSCWDASRRSRSLWRWLVDRPKPAPPPENPLAASIARGLDRLRIAEAYFLAGIEHPDLGLGSTLPPHRWPEGYEERMK